MIKIVSFKICPFVQRVTGLLEAKKIPYELEYISLKDKPQWFLDISPTGQVPMLITESGKALFESDAIIEYIDEISAPVEAGLTPEDRAFDRAWSYQASKHYLVQCSTMRSGDKDTLTERTEKLAKAFAKAEKQLGEGTFFKGDQLSNIDIAWLPLLHRADIIREHTGYDLLNGYPKVQAWQASVMKTGLAEASVAEDFETAFTDFYLSDQTWLGNQDKCTPSNSSADNACASGTCC
ncbi:glutathione S-transferase family protein [Aliamphritea spongicola]|uniref:glutathione S-transferase family protein n=1 Tax=Aliamphritea spongicola TaxID=707589 RepID=UPI00196A30A8|nr:glutathione S-transferase family protein [Aliamphritea spongicola]MBN3562739.1 glutathione S-transferase family protein [Aliamphritea spongicola]